MIKISMTYLVQNRVVKDASCYLRNEQLNLPFSLIYFKGEVFLSTMCMQIETFHVSIIAQNATMVIYRILFGGMHPIGWYIQLFNCCNQLVWKEGNVLFNNVLNTFYLRLYGIGHMVKDHSDSKIGNPLPPHGLLFPISSKGSFICIIPQAG